MSTGNSTSVHTTTILQDLQFKDEAEEQKSENITIVKLKPKVKKIVKWTEDTVDNEHMNRFKSNGTKAIINEINSYSLLYIS